MKIKIGQRIKYQPWGERPTFATIEDIEVCESGEKNGDSVDEADTRPAFGKRLVISLDNGHWCYGDQVIG